MPIEQRFWLSPNNDLHDPNHPNNQPDAVQKRHAKIAGILVTLPAASDGFNEPVPKETLIEILQREIIYAYQHCADLSGLYDSYARCEFGNRLEIMQELRAVHQIATAKEDALHFLQHNSRPLYFTYRPGCTSSQHNISIDFLTEVEQQYQEKLERLEAAKPKPVRQRPKIDSISSEEECEIMQAQEAQDEPQMSYEELMRAQHVGRMLPYIIGEGEDFVRVINVDQPPAQSPEPMPEQMGDADEACCQVQVDRHFYKKSALVALTADTRQFERVTALGLEIVLSLNVEGDQEIPPLGRLRDYLRITIENLKEEREELYVKLGSIDPKLPNWEKNAIHNKLTRQIDKINLTLPTFNETLTLIEKEHIPVSFTYLSHCEDPVRVMQVKYTNGQNRNELERPPY